MSNKSLDLIFAPIASHATKPSAIALQTRKGWDIPNQIPLRAQQEQPQLEKFILNPKYDLELRRDADHSYNCVGHVWAARRTYIEPLRHIIDNILEDDGYRSIEVTDVREGDLVLYLADGEWTHVGMIVCERRIVRGVTKRGPFVLSKMGSLGSEYIHHYQNLPEDYGKPHFFTDRSTPKIIK